MLLLVDDQVLHLGRNLRHSLLVGKQKMNGASFEITNADDKYKVLFIEPLGLKFGMDSQSCYTLVVEGEEPFEMYLGDSDEVIHIEFQGDVSFKVLEGDEELRSGHNLLF